MTNGIINAMICGTIFQEDLIYNIEALYMWKQVMDTLYNREFGREKQWFDKVVGLK